MTIPGSANPLLLRSASTAYTISRSLRFNSSDSAFCSRVVSSAGDRKKWTWSGWAKRSKLGATGGLFGSVISSGLGGSWAEFIFNSVDGLGFQSYASGGYNWYWRTNAVFRDTSAWYHVMIVCDQTEASVSNAIKFYVNGVLATHAETPSTWVTNQNLQINAANTHNIGKFDWTAEYYSGYLADIHFIDGQALTPSSFGEFDTNNVWQPKAYTGTYGTNGFRLPFSDNSNNTATTLGKDSAGSNNWTPNNFSVTAGAGNDSLVDSPSSPAGQTDSGAGGTVVGNYCTANSLDNLATLSNGNLQVQSPGASYVNARGTVAFPSTGKWYAEATVTSNTSGSSIVTFGLATKSASLNAGYGSASNIFVFLVGSTLVCYNSTTVVFDVAGTLVSGDVMQIAYDADTGKVWVGANNTWRNSTGGTTGNPGAGTNQTFTLSAGEYFPFVGGYANTLNANFGQRPFAYTAPSGFKALCTANLPTPTIPDGSKAMDVKLYTGNGSSQTISGLGFEPGFVWIKNRSHGRDNNVYDAVRGATKLLSTNSTTFDVYDGTGSEQTISGLTAFNSDGFSVGSNNVANQSTYTYAAWCWNAGTGSPVSNPDGSITSQVRANASAGFSVVTYTGNGSSTDVTVGHGLGVAPQLVIVKSRGSASNGNWRVGHSSLATNNNLLLNATDAQFSATSTAAGGGVATSHSSTTITLKAGPGGGGFNPTDYVNQNTITYVAYCFAPVAGYSSAFSITGNGSTDGPFCFLGFRPRFLIYKRTDSTANWRVLDTARDLFNVASAELYPSLSNAEQSFAALDILSNGFKLRNTDASYNASGGTYIGFAWAESPFSLARAR